ncbi:hypothetical protein [Devosia pacifica]|uniref:hypothetical protein n=1 Tax=Devosia pacifica TaxID=1335967 RepID=UPI0016772E30|nr:hypothetical protein [Devosia pacifica]
MTLAAAAFGVLTAAAGAQDMQSPSTPQMSPGTGAEAESVAPDGEPVTAYAMPPNPNDLLTGLYATRATAEACDIDVDSEVASAMAADEARYIDQLGLTGDAAAEAYDQIVTTLDAQGLDCAEGSADVASVTRVLDLYAQQ